MSKNGRKRRTWTQRLIRRENRKSIGLLQRLQREVEQELQDGRIVGDEPVSETTTKKEGTT